MVSSPFKRPSPQAKHGLGKKSETKSLKISRRRESTMGIIFAPTDVPHEIAVLEVHQKDYSGSDSKCH